MEDTTRFTHTLPSRYGLTGYRHYAYDYKQDIPPKDFRPKWQQEKDRDCVPTADKRKQLRKKRRK